MTSPIATLCAAACLMLAACAGGKPDRADRAGGPRAALTEVSPATIREPILAVGGQTLVLPLHPPRVIDDGATWRPEVPIVTLNGSERSVAVHRVIAIAEEGGWSRTYTWSEAQPGEPIDRPAVDAWVALVDLTGAPPGALTVDGRRVRTTWAVDTGAFPAPTRSGAETFAHLVGDPLDGWRTELAGATPALAPIDVPGALGASRTALWRAALALLHQADQVLYADVARRLTATLDANDGARRPAWPLDAGSEPLMRDLITAASSVNRAAIARAWLGRQRGVVAWVTEDSPEAGLSRVAIAEVGGRERTVGAAGLGQVSVNSRTLLPFETAVFDVPLKRAGAGLQATIEVRVDGETSRLRAAPWSAPVAPPGLRITGLMREWDQTSWLVGAPIVEPAPRATAAQLYYDEQARSWRIFIECRNDAQLTNDRVELHITSARGAQVISADRTGVVAHGGADRPELLVSLEDDGRTWTVILDLPDDAMPARGQPVFALARVVGGIRSTWPRATMPGDAPSGIRLDLGAWSPDPQPAPSTSSSSSSTSRDSSSSSSDGT